MLEKASQCATHARADPCQDGGTAPQGLGKKLITRIRTGRISEREQAGSPESFRQTDEPRV
jgi:hypothetical protein